MKINLINKIKNSPEKRKEIMLIIFILAISGIAHGYNMFNFPYYENDEGVYMSQAWSLITQGKLAPYTYWYDHSPAGWIFIALWTKLTGGFFTFGMTINTGRVFMLILHLFSTLFLFKIAKKISNSNYGAFFTTLFFALSPLGIYFQRRVLLDNIMIFWLLLSIYLLFCFRKRLIIIILSSIAFALSCLSKESAVFFLPVLFYLTLLKIDRRHRKLGITLWITVFIMVCSLYPLYAILKGELFPMGSIFDQGGEHVSLIETLAWQASREGGMFFSLFEQWLSSDPLIIILGVFSTLINLLLGIKKKYFRIAALLSISYIIYIIRGGILIEFYIIGLTPFLALNIGIFISFLLNKIKNKTSKKTLAFLLFLILSLFFLNKSKDIRGVLSKGQNIYTSNQTISQIEALNWSKKNISSDKTVILDNYAYIEMKDSYVSAIPYENAEWYWKALRDPEVKNSRLMNNWENIDYVLSTPQMEHDINISGSVLFQETFINSKPIKTFWSDGWGVYAWKTYNPEQILEDSWENYKENFLTEEGRVINPYDNNFTTSEGQSYALLRSVWTNDKDTFDKVLGWTNKNLKLKSNNLFAWSWIQNNNGIWETRDNGTATDADQDIALALLFAYKQWGEESYLEQAKYIIKDIWEYEVIEIQEKPYLTAGNWAPQKEQSTIINPSYFSPYAYRIFAEVDSDHNWIDLVDTSYEILIKGSQNPLDKDSTLGLPPDWLAISTEGEIEVAYGTDSIFSTDYSYDAIRVPWRVALDWKWYNEPLAEEYLKSLSFLESTWEAQNKILASYSHDGAYYENYEATESYGGNIGYFIVVRPDLAEEVYEKKLLGKYYENDNNKYWDDPQNYYKQNWAWFGTALYADKLPNLWSK